MTEGVSLIERKQRRARQRIIEAADELFASRGFDQVSVSDIAERAEVGRTSFFRHFGDKQEVVFAREHEVLALVAAEDVVGPGSDPHSLADALRALEPVILRITAQMIANADGFRRHVQLVKAHAGLRERDAAKLQVIAGRLGDLLTVRGWDDAVSVLSAQLAVACFQAARGTTTDPRSLVEATRSAFAQTLALGTVRG
ncbi:TetR/AcrR family transcriptional regulator [Microbacterium terrisoli]|jgi:AcrR family transcriptional regulator|uniref:TetR/AcrR family transcriptional regulator n=1 Tax=Microbacterium terrisoli TaxID=3242192 RepID=UPI002804B8EC|nr:helix-turn-helix domain-containing protein [Microbacterium protaetiae]